MQWQRAMLNIANLHKSYGAQVLFDGASMQMAPGERLGLVGRNGHGKSTLLRLILGQEEMDDGQISMPKNYRIGHLEQHINFTKPTVLEEACLGLPEEEWWDQYKAEKILFGLGFNEADMNRAPSEFSGGYQIRLNLAKVLVSDPNLLLLDEPTNYLDIVSIRWIIKFLRSWKNELMIISHDREFMDAVTTHTAMIHRQQIKRVSGGTAKLYEQIAQEEETYEKTRQNQEKQRAHAEAFVARFRAQASKAAMVQSRVKQLDKLPKLEKLENIHDLDFNFHYAPFEAKNVVEVSDLTFGFDPAKPLIRDLSFTIQSGDCIAVIGKNGKGKSTLLNVLAGELEPQHGEIKSHPNVQLGYFGQTNISRLDPKLTVEQEVSNANGKLGRTQVRGICGVMMFGGDLAEKKVSHLSGGEKSRVLLGKILASPANLLFLDEPTNHLDMQSVEALIEAIQVFEGSSVIVTHSEEMIRALANKLIIFHHNKVELYAGTYDEFLEKIGWDEDGESAAEAAPVLVAKKTEEAVVEPSVNKKEQRKQRAEVLAEKERVLGPLKKDIEKLEATIFEQEAEVKKLNEELIAAGVNKDVTAFAGLSKKIKELQKNIEENFSQLEKISEKYQEQQKRFDA